MTFCLNAKIIKPEDKNIKNAVILLHGYGGDGNDIAPVTINWKRFLQIPFLFVLMGQKHAL